MSKILQFSILIVFIFLAGCTSISNYDDHEVAAIVKGQEITIGDLRFLYPDDTALNYLEWTITAELVKQEVENMGLDISHKIYDDRFEELPPKDTKDIDGKQVRKYAQSQGKKLGMSPEKFQREYVSKIKERNAYLDTFLEKKLGHGNINDPKWMEKYGEQFDYLLEELVEENKGEIERLIE